MVSKPVNVVQVSFIVEGQYVTFEEPKEPSLKVENNSIDSLKANSAWKERGKQAVPPHQQAAKNRGSSGCTLPSVSRFSAIHSCRYTLSMSYQTCSGPHPSQKHSCSRFLIFTQSGSHLTNHQRFCPGTSSFLSLLTLSQKVAIIASL